jgi:hypothetical protein
VVYITSSDHISFSVGIVVNPSSFGVANYYRVVSRATRSPYRALVKPTDYYRPTSV